MNQGSLRCLLIFCRCAEKARHRGSLKLDEPDSGGLLTCVKTAAHLYPRIYAYTCMRIYVDVHLHVHVRTYMHMQMYMYMYILYMYAYEYEYENKNKNA